MLSEAKQLTRWGPRWTEVRNLRLSHPYRYNELVMMRQKAALEGRGFDCVEVGKYLDSLKEKEASNGK